MSAALSLNIFILNTWDIQTSGGASLTWAVLTVASSLEMGIFGMVIKASLLMLV